MKAKKRFFSLLLALCLVFGSTPTVVFAKENSGKAIQIGMSQIEGKQADSIYFGTYQQSSDGSGGYNKDPVKWQVLSNEEDKLLLFADTILDIKDYNDVKDETPDRNIYWSECSLREWLNDGFIKTAFYENERTAISQTEITTSKFDLPNGSSQTVSSTGTETTTDQVFLLSVEDAKTEAYFPGDWTSSAFGPGKTSLLASHTTDYVKGITGTEDIHYWLRTPGSQYETRKYYESFSHYDSASEILFGDGIVDDRGLAVYLVSQGHTYAGGVRPAFNLDSSKVLFTSAAVNGKTTGNLSPVADYTGNEWKLTLLDGNRSSFTADASEAETSVEVGYSNWNIPITYSDAQTGANEYVSVLLCDSSDTVLYYGNIAQNSANGKAILNIPSGLAVGNYTLKVFSEQCNGDYKTDYASAFQEISLTVTLPRETTPQASFTATGDNGGILSNIDTSMKYSTDGGVNWNAVTGTSIELTGVTAANDVKVYKPGNGSTTSDSAVQTIDITQASKPTVSGADCTTSQQNDGKITGVDSTMEYKLSTASEWTDITDTEVTKLSNGTYDVRVKANGTVLASAAATVTIGAHTCVAQGAWQYDADEHWKLCACGAEVGTEAHSGGEATCTALAVCDTCGEEYGEVNASNHTNLVKTEAKAATHMTEGNIEYWYCDGCDKYFSDEAGTKEIALADTVIPKLTEHTADGTGWHSDETNHWNTCECGEKLNEAAHTFEWVIDKEATATEKGSKHEKCTVCGYEKTAVEIPATGTPSDTDTSSPQTGDDSNIVLWIAVMLAAGAALTGTAVYSRKRKHSR